uniref:Sodium-coupled monocarboxylate transporter 2 n=1 Tax=Panagrellus redivivus TaxID=6233 RepID=A0A7E4VLP0_PANRE
MFKTVDFIIFGCFLTFSILVGVYHAIKAKSKAASGHGESAEFLVGGRKLPIFPVCLSLLTTFISGIALLGLPAEIYQRGALLGLGFIPGAISFLISGYFFVPIFYKLQFTSVYEYMEVRYDSRLLRRVGSSLFLISTLFYMAVVLYAPSVALVGVTDLPLWPFILAVGAVSTIYTAIGGIKAVIWTDTLQAVFMYIGLGTLLIKGVSDAGGLANIFELAERTGHMSDSVFKFDPTPFQYDSFWIIILGGVLHWTCFYGLNQMALQRYCSMPSLRHARVVMTCTVPAFWAIGLMCGFIGLLCLAYFHGCDPVAIGEIESMDQMSILLAARVLAIIPGMPGLFLASLYSATLSTTSSGANSMTAVIWEDFLKDSYSHWSEAKITKLMKALAFAIGAASTLLAFACDYMGGIFNAATTTLSATAAPLVGLFFLGVFVPKANKNGAFAGLICALMITIMCSIANNIEKPYKNYVLPLTPNANNPNCRDLALNSSTHADVHISVFKHHTGPHPHQSHKDWHYGDPNSSLLARTSPFSYAVIGISVVMIVGTIVSHLFPVKLPEQKAYLAAACTYAGRDLKFDKSTYGSELQAVVNNKLSSVSSEKESGKYLNFFAD